MTAFEIHRLLQRAAVLLVSGPQEGIWIIVFTTLPKEAKKEFERCDGWLFLSFAWRP